MAVAAHYLQIVNSGNEKIFGESEGHEHESWIDVIGWNWNVADQSTPPTDASDTPSPRGARTGPSSTQAPAVAVVPADFTFRKSVDASTTQMMKAMYSGEVLKKATFTLFEELVDVGKNHRGAFRLHVVLENVIVTGYRLGGRSSPFRVDLDETWTLTYGKVSFLYETERMNAFFDRQPGVTPRAQVRREPTFLEQLKKYGITPDELAKAKAKGKRE
jgi:type VI protein secretion system component Hcp